MTKEEFEKIKAMPAPDRKSIRFDNIAFNLRVWSYCYNDDYERFKYMLNMEGNSVKTNEEGIADLQALLYCGVFPMEIWEKILPDIIFMDFNRDFDKMVEDTLPSFRKIEPFYEDLHLEIWQGIFSFDTHWCVEGLPLEKQINSPENGEVYCNTLLEIYPYINAFLEKYPFGHYSLFRLAEAVGYGDPAPTEGILIRDREKNSLMAKEV